MPYPYSYFNPNKKELAALGAGSLVAALLGAASGDNASDALVRGVASGTAGFGTGYNQYQNYMNDAWQRDIADKRFGQQVREYEEIDKPYKEAIVGAMANKSNQGGPDYPGYTDYEKTKQQLDINEQRLKNRKLKKELLSNNGEDILKKSQTANIAHGIRQEMRLNPYVKDFQDVNQKYSVMEKALKESENVKNLIAIDQSLISMFNKMIDPASVVRESEYARTQEDQAMFNRIKGRIAKMATGGAGLVPEERAALVDMARRFYDTYKVNYDDTINNYIELANQTGINPKLISTTFKRKLSPMEELEELAKNGDQTAIQYLQSRKKQ